MDFENPLLFAVCNIVEGCPSGQPGFVYNIVFIPRPRSKGGGYCHHHVWPCVCTSVFRFRRISLKPLVGLLSNCISLVVFILRRLLTSIDWGYNKNRIFKLQKRAVRIITLSNYISHSEPIFKTLNLLNIDDIHKMNQYKFIHKLYNSSLPAYFNSLPLTSLSDIHQHNTRNKCSLLVPKVKHEFAKMTIRYDIPHLMNKSPSLILDKIHTHCLGGFSSYIKKCMINNYSDTCSLSNCYVCQRLH